MAIATLSNLRQDLSKIELSGLDSLPGAVDYFDAGAASTGIFAGLPVHL